MKVETLSGLPSARPSQLEAAYYAFHRIVALVCLVMGLVYWVRLLGFYPGLMWRFDLMPIHWQVASIVLAVLYPFASVGLWLVAPWGAVIWFLCAGTEVAMYGFMPEMFGRNYPLLGFHLLVAITYAGLRIARYRRKRQAML